MLCDVSSKGCVCGVCVYVSEVRVRDRRGAEEEEGGCRVLVVPGVWRQSLERLVK